MQTCVQHAARDPEEEFLGKRETAVSADPCDITEMIEQHKVRLAKELFYKANHLVISNLSRSTFVKPRPMKVLARRVVRTGSFDSAETAETASSMTEPQSPASCQSRGPETANASLVSSFINEFENTLSQSISDQQQKCLKHVNECLQKVCLSQLSQIALKVQNIVINPSTDLALALLRLSCRKARVTKAQYQNAANIVVGCSSDRALSQSDTYRAVVCLFQKLSSDDQDC